MNSRKYIGMDVHKESISIAVSNNAGKTLMECVIETKASVILDFINGLRGELQVTFEEGTWAAWLYDLLKITEPGVRRRAEFYYQQLDALSVAAATVQLVGFRTTRLRCESVMENCRERISRLLPVRSAPKRWSEVSENLLPDYTGLKTIKIPAAGKLFLLTFPFIEPLRS